MRLAVEETDTESLFETLASKSPAGLYIVQDGKFCYTNFAFQSLTGYREDELLGKNSLELVVPEDRKHVRENAVKMLKGERTLPYQFRFTRKNGSIKWVMESVVSVQYRGRRAILGDFIDITAHKQAEEALQAEKNKLQSVIGAMGDGLTIQDKDYNIIYQNEALRKNYGDRSGEKCYRVYEGRDKPCDGCPVKKAFKDGKSHISVRRVVMPSGEVVFVEARANPIRDAEGKIVSCLEVVRNITERKRVEEKLKDATQKWMSLVENTSDFIMIIDNKGKIQYINRAIPPHDVDHVIGKTLHDFAAPEHHESIKKAVAKVFETGKEAGYESTVKHPTGVRSFETVMVPIVEGGKVISAMSFNEDITERKQTEEALQAERNKLQSLIDAIEYTITIQDKEYNIIYQNEPSRIASGGDYLGEKCYRAYEGREKVCERCPVEEAFKGGKSHTTERKTKISGKVALWENTAIPIRDAGGKIVSCLELARDITERKKAEEALQMERNKLQSVVDAMEDDLTIQDTEYNIIFQNEPAKINSGGDHVGEKCYRVYERRESICEDCPVEKAFKDGKPHTTEKQQVLPSGELSFFENTANPIRDAEGKVVACLEIGRNITERKRQEQALADELTQRRLLIDKSLDGIVVLDEDSRVVEANQRFADMLGYTLEEVHELHTWDWDKNFPPEKILEMGRNVDEEGLRLETKHTRKDGSVFDVDISISGIMYGERKLIFCIDRDITERNQAEEALQVERNKLQSLIDALDYTITIQDKEYNIIYQNEPSKIASGGDHLGEKCYRAYEGREKVCDGCPVEGAFKDGKSHTRERRTKISGEVAFWENTANPIRDAEGKVVSCLELAKNITERRRMEEALRDSEEKLRKMFESVIDGILVIDLKGSITEVNQRSVEMHGFSSTDELRGKSAFNLVAPHDHERIATAMKEAIKKGTIRRAEYTLLRADSSEFPGELSTSVLKDASGNVVGHITIVRDITEHRRAREEREALLQDIKKSNRKLEVANKELQDFVYVASHDLREPLRKISSFGTLLQDSLKRKLDEDQQENLGFMIDGARRMQDMIDALLSYSRLTTKAEPLQQVFLDEVVENLKKLELATLLDETRGTIHIPEPLPPVRADPSQMNQLFQNLIGNGLKFHREGIRPKIIIRAHGVENKMIQVEVEDNGIGIDEKYHEQLFVMFKRLHSRAQYEGTGIGLAICKKIIERHGGNIGVKSTPGKGSTFWFTLPRGSYLKED